MKIWHVSTEIPIPEIFTGGMGCHVWNVAREQVKLGHDVKIWCKIRSEEIVEGITFKPFITLGPRYQSELALQQHLQWETAKDIAKEAEREGRPDILHNHEWDSAAITEDASIRLGVPWVTTLHLSNTLNSQHMTPHFDELVSYYLWWEQQMMLRANGVIAISEYYRGWIKHFTDKPIRTILNGVNVEDFEGGPEVMLPRDKLTAFFHGRLCMQKGLRIIADAAKQRDDIFWVVAGPMAGTHDGRCLEDALLRDLNTLQDEGKLLMPGMLSQPEIGSYLRACDVAVYPHLRAPFDCAVLEAMACGALVITTGVDAISEYLGVSAIIIDNKVSSLLSAIDTAQSCDFNYMREGAKEQARNFTWRDTTIQTLDFYGDILYGNKDNTKPECSNQRSAARGFLLDEASA